jgi:NAD(P)-dependent dehydrogenase (short-subunit alcohol dehydrogenase family)
MSAQANRSTDASRRVVIVTGASSGIGRATAVKLAASGTAVVVAARREDRLHAVAAEIDRCGGNAVAVAADVTDLGEVDRLVERAMSINGRIDGLVNVAGIGHGHSIMTDDALVDRMIATNLLAPIRLMRAVIPIMVEQRAGAIVNIGSIAGEIGFSGVYSATKFGLRGLTDSVRQELAGTGVTATLIEPGYIATELTAGQSTRMPGPEIVARAVDRALRRPRRRIIVPARFRIPVVLATVFPSIVDRLFAQRAAERAGVRRGQPRPGDAGSYARSPRSPAALERGVARLR